MRVKFFAIPALDPADAVDELNRFLASHRVLSIDRQLVADGGGSFWAVDITYSQRPVPGAPPKKGRVDYKEVLSPGDFEVYAALRELRKQIAEQRGVPTYAVFNNAQLAEMVEKRMRTREQLAKIAGVGPSKIEAHGPRFLERLRELQAAERSGGARDEADGDPGGALDPISLLSAGPGGRRRIVSGRRCASRAAEAAANPRRCPLVTICRPSGGREAA